MITIVRTFKIYSLRKFQICDTLLLTVAPVHYIPMTSLFYNWKYVLCHPLHPFHPSFQHPGLLATTNLYIFFVCFIPVNTHIFSDIVFKKNSRIKVYVYTILEVIANLTYPTPVMRLPVSPFPLIL